MSDIQLFKPYIREESIVAVSDVLRSGWIGCGPKTAEFEKDFSAYTGSGYSLALNSCTSALHIAMRLCEVGARHIGTQDTLPPAVITTANTFVSTNHAILYEGATPLFADIEYNTGNIAADSIRKVIDENREKYSIRAVVCVHYGGQPCDMDEIKEVCSMSEHYVSIPIIEDAAHACGASYKNKMVGSISSITCFSFQAVKNLPIGDGGMINLKDEDMYERAKNLSWLGIDRSTFSRANTGNYKWQYNIKEVGFKYHMNDINAAIGVEQLKVLEEDNDRRREIFKAYNDGLKNKSQIKLVETKPNRISSQHLIVAQLHGTKERNSLMDYLSSCNIHCGMHYRRNDEYDMYVGHDLPNTQRFCDTSLSLPNHLHLSDDDISLVIDKINEATS